MAITTVTVADNVKRELSDLDADIFSEDADVLTRLIIGNARGTSNTYTLQQVAPGYYVYQAGPLCLFTVGSTFYTETGGVSSKFDSGTDRRPPCIVVSAGTQSGDTIAVTATPIDFAEVVAQTLELMAERADQKPDTQAVGSGNLTVNTLGSRLRKAARDRRGGYGV